MIVRASCRVAIVKDAVIDLALHAPAPVVLEAVIYNELDGIAGVEPDLGALEASLRLI